METAKKMGADMGIGIDIPGVLRSIIKQLAYIIIFGIIVGIWGYIGLNQFAPKKYQTTASIVVIANQNLSRNLLEYQMENAIDQYEGILGGDLFRQILWEELSESEKSQSEFTTAVSGNMITMKATARNPETAYKLIKNAISQYRSVAEYLTSGYIAETLSYPQISRVTEVSNNAPLSALLAGVLAALCTAGAVGITHIFSGKIDNRMQAMRRLDADCVGEIQYESKVGYRKNKDSLLITKPIVSFSYTMDVKKIVSRLERMMEEKNKQVLLVGSTIENEGKSTIASNIALVLAQRKKKVLLLDFDLRKPSLAKILGYEIPAEKEITQVLARADSKDIKWDFDPPNNIYYIFGTKVVKDDEVLTVMNNLQMLLERAKAEMDYVILDSAPVFLSQDTQIISGYVDAVLFVACQGEAKTDMINESIYECEEAGADVLGIVLNRVKTKVVTAGKRDVRYKRID